jgi:hypothetical protein
MSDISTAIIACLLVVLGSDINAFVRRLMRTQHFILKTCVFIVINAFGYGFIIIKTTPYLTRTLLHLERGMMFLVILGIFLFIGLWAQRNRHI